MSNQQPVGTPSVSVKYTSPYIDLWIDDDVLYCKYADNLHLSLDVAKFCVEKRIFFAQGRSYALLVDMKGIRSTTPEARHYMATIGSTLVKAGALVVGSTINRAIGNIFLTIDKPPVPLRLFNSEKKALDWLQRFK